MSAPSRIGRCLRTAPIAAARARLAARGRAAARAAGAALGLAAAVTALFAAPIAVSPSTAMAGVYEMRNCLSTGAVRMDGVFERYGNGRVDVAESCSKQGNGSVGISQNRNGGQIGNGVGAAYRWHAPAGAPIVRTRINGYLRNENGVAAQIYVTNADGGYRSVDGGAPHDGVRRQMNDSFTGGPRRQFVARLACFNPGCPNRENVRKAYFQLRHIVLELRDTTAPSVSASGQMVTTSQPVRGSVGYSVSASDDGGGVRELFARINGTDFTLSTVSCPGDRGGYADRTRPCPASASRSGQLNTANSPFREGSNTVRLCARDYATGSLGTSSGPNTGCSATRTITVDNQAPPRPPEISVVGGSGWRADNDFTVRWEAPEGQVTPIVAALYRIDNADGATVQAERVVNGTNLTEIPSVTVPEPGEYLVSVRLRDAAGNTGSAAVVILRFDDLRPDRADPIVTGSWLSASDFPLTGQIEPVQPAGPSGIAGYAVGLGSHSASIPCPTGRCNPGEYLIPPTLGIPALTVPQMDEGHHWLATAAVSGAGLRSAEVNPAALEVDLTDPVTVAEVSPSKSWSRVPVTVRVKATDALSGMRPDPDAGGNQPLTAISLNGGEPKFRVGDEISVTIERDGVHTIRHWARDLAGNANNGVRLSNGHRHDPPGSEVVRVDATPPVVAFAASVDPRQPEQILARASDRLSGVWSGRIEYRAAGSGAAFRALDSRLDRDSLRAHFPSDDHPPGAYEFRAVVSDRAGNVAIADRREDGSAMVLSNPLKLVPRLRIGWRGSERPRVVSHPRRAIEIAGIVSAPDGVAMGGSTVEIVERFDHGAWPTQRVTRTRADRTGKFATRLAPGPSRTVTARFAGTRRLARAESSRLRLVARGAARLAVGPQIVRNGRPVRMQGAVRSRGARVPANGKLVAIQYFDPERRRWRPVEVIRTDRRGRFAYAYRFRTIGFAQRIVFRAVALPEAGWPYTPAATAPRAVVVYPR